jgi:glycosyltransferase involved in cell wall biosynthesis
MNWLTKYLSEKQGVGAERGIEAGALHVTSRFYRLAKVLFAPNEELCTLLKKATGRPCHLMQRGVDTSLFSPTRRSREEDDGSFLLGYVGRLSIEKNVALLIRIERELTAMGFDGTRFVIVGHGSEEASLRAALTRAGFAGVLRGAELARAYADMDVLVFPSHTDTFGNVVLEALASGVPAVVTGDGGPKFIVREGKTGFIAADEAFPSAIARLMQDRLLLQTMRRSARAYALGCSWDAVFEKVYAGYLTALPSGAFIAPNAVEAERPR